MEYRKLISFGKSSFVVSLPKAWVVQNKLKKGATIYFESASTDKLIISSKGGEEENKNKEVKIEVDGKEIRRIQRELISAYIQNYKTITLVGNEIKEKAIKIQEFIQNLVALEVIEQDLKRIVAKDFLNLNDISLEQAMRKMDVIIRSMFIDCLESFNENFYENISLRDNDVNKFRFLIYRIISTALDNPSMILRKLNLDLKSVFNYWWMAYSLESIADRIKRISKTMPEIKLEPAEKAKFLVLLKNVESSYTDMMKAYYNGDIEKVHSILQDRNNIFEKLDNFDDDNSNVKKVGYLIYNVKSLFVTVHTVGRIVYQGIPG